MRRSLQYPLIPGYEQVGVVDYVGHQAPLTATGERLRAGDRVMANEVRAYPDYHAVWGGQVAVSIKNATTLATTFDMPAKIPEAVSDPEATVAYIAAVAKKGIDNAGVQPGETMVVIGMGALGLAAIQIARVRGARVLGVEISPWRAERAKPAADAIICSDATTDDAITQVADLTGGRMADVIIEASGNAKVAAHCIALLREGGFDPGNEGGRIHLLGHYAEPVLLNDYDSWFHRNPRITISCAFRAGDKEAVLDLIRTGVLNARLLWDKEIALTDAPAAYAELDLKRATRLKTLIRWPA